MGSARLVLALGFVLASVPAGAASFSATSPRWAARDSTGAPQVGAPAGVERVEWWFKLDRGPWRLWFSVQASTPGSLDGYRFGRWGLSMPDGLYADSVAARVQAWDASGNGPGWTVLTRAKRPAPRAQVELEAAYSDTLRSRGAIGP